VNDGFATAQAFWLGFLTSISPCLLATNIAAISFLARRVDKPRLVFLSGLCYLVGQAVAFVLLAMLLVEGLLSVPLVSHWLQKYMFRLLGPLMILCAMLLLELISVQLGRGKLKAWAQEHTRAGGYWAAALLGIVFAMSFCPTTAALFFGGLLPLSIERESSLYLPFVYAMGVALPVLVFSTIVATAAHKVGVVYAKVAAMERPARYITGCIFLVVGIWFTVAFTFGLSD
jgi:cytochrome c biogenesis protein CcdA